MALNRSFNLGPVLLTTNPATNILNPAITNTAGPVGFVMPQPYILLQHLRVTNRTAVAITVSLWKGIAAGNIVGTEFVWAQKSVPAYDSVDAIGLWRFDAADFLVGGANQANALILTAEGEIGVSG